MKKIMYIAVAAIAVLSSCSSEEFTQSSGNGNNGDAKVFTATIESDGAATRTTLTSENKVNWVYGDKVNIGGKEYTAASDGATTTFTGTGAAISGDVYKAYYPSTMYNEGTITLPASYTYDASKTDVAQFNMPMYAESATTDLSFQNICGVLAIKVTSAEMSSVTSITVTSDKAISGTCTINGDGTEGNKYYATASGSEDADKTVTLTCTSAVTPSSDGTIFYIPVPVLSESSTLYITVHGTAVEKDEYKNLIYTQSMKATGVTIARNNIYKKSFATSLAKFKVASDKTVYFTNGNVYCDANSGTLSNSNLHFETSQIGYDKGTTSGDATTYTSNHVSHFFWDPALANCVASSYTKTTGWYFSTSSFTGSSVDGTTGLLTLTQNELTYLIKTRGANLRKACVAVTDGNNTAANCLIIAPENFIGTLKESYTAAELKAYGLVCLPAAGSRSGTVLYKGESDGFYWSSTNTVLKGNSYNCTGYLHFSNIDIENLSPQVNADPTPPETGSGMAVRLVKTVE